MSPKPRSTEVNALKGIEAQLEDLRREVREARADSAASFAAVDRVARTIRVSRRQVMEAEMQAGWDRLRPDTSVIRWQPRGGEADQPELGTGLIDRLKAGDKVSDTLGNISPFVGAANALTDPLLETFGSADILTTLTSFGPWRGIYSLASGSVTAHASVDDLYWRAAEDNPFNSEIVGLYGPRGTAAHDSTTTLYADAALPSYQTNLPYVVAAVEAISFAVAQDASLTTCQVTLEIYDTDTATVVASTSHDLLATPLTAPLRLECYAVVDAPDAYYQWRLKLRVVKTTSAAPQGGFVFFGEPQLHLSYTTDPIGFQPPVAWWQPARLTMFGMTGPEALLDIFQSNGNGVIRFGSGVSGNQDVQLERSAAGVLRLHENGKTGIDAALQIGDDSILFDVDVADRLGIKGASTAANGGFIFGSGKDTNLYRSAADVLKTDDAFQGASLAIGSNKVARYVGLTSHLSPINSETYTASDGSVQTSAELTGLPSSGVVAVQAVLIVAADAQNNANYVLAQNWGGGSANYAFLCYAGQVAGTYNSAAGIITTGGTNNRQVQYQRYRGAGTVTWFLRITGYWTTE